MHFSRSVRLTRALVATAALLLASPRAYAHHGVELPVPETLFHAGTRTNLEANIRNGQIAHDVWTNFIFGATNYDLPDYRKGLYGGETIGSVDLYFQEQLLEGIEPWIMMIHLPLECRTRAASFVPNAFATKVDPRADASDNRFALWLKQHPEKYADARNFCVENDYWKEGSPYSLKDAGPEDREIDLKCEPALSEFISLKENRVIFDEYNYLPAWYIRDPSCVAKIDGTADEFFDALAANVGNPDYEFVENLFGPDSEKPTPVQGSTFFIMKVLAETSRLRPNAKPWLMKTQKELAEYIPDYQPIPSLWAGNDNYYILGRVFGSAARAIAENRVSAFQNQLKSWITKATREIGASCHGGKDGHVPKERYQACGDTHFRLTNELMNILK